MVDDAHSDDALGRTLALGFSGYAAAFQPEVEHFLVGPGRHLGGLRHLSDRAAFVQNAISARPDYLVLAVDDGSPEIMQAIQQRVPATHFAVLAVAEAKIRTTFPESVEVELVSPNEPLSDIALTLRALLRRSRPQALVGQTHWHDLSLDEACLTFAIRDARVTISLEIFCALGAMMDDPGRVWSRADLHRLVFGATSSNDIRALDMRISRTRRHVSAALGADPIRSVRGVGYALVAEP